MVLVGIESAQQLFIIPLMSLEETNGKKFSTKIRLGPITPWFGLHGSALLGTVCRFVRSSKGGSPGKRENLGRTSGDSKMEIKEQGEERVGSREELNQIYYMPVYK